MMFKYFPTLKVQILLYLTVVFFSVEAASQVVDANFYPKIITGSPVAPRVSVVQPDGKIIIGVSGLSRLLPDGTTDPDWTPPGFDGPINDVIVQTDGKILVGGGFKFVSGVRQEGLVRLNTEGTVDASYPAIFNNFGMTVNALALQPDGKLLVAQNSIFLNRLIRLDSNGMPDNTFQTTLPQDAVNLTAMSLQPDGKFLLAYRVYEGQWTSKLGRFNGDGTADGSFSPFELIGTGAISGGSPDVDSILFLPDGKFLIAGSFSSVGGVLKNHIARINSDGTLDLSYQASADGAVFTIVRQADGSTLAGGTFSEINGVTRKRLARLNSDGSLDPSFAVSFDNPSDSVTTINHLQNGDILIGGEFIRIDTTTRYRFARLNANGTVDSDFAFVFLAGRSPANFIVPRPDGKILIGGSFAVVNGDMRSKIALINPDGTTDAAFPDLNFGSTVRSMLVGPDNQILIGGDLFCTLQAFNSDGSVNSAFASPLTRDNCDGIFALARQPDGKILVGGSFALNGTFRNNLARLNIDGSIDNTFMNNLTGPNLTVARIVLQPDGKILVSGLFTEVSGQSRNRIARLNADGTLDHTFQNGMTGLKAGNDSVYADVLERLPDGKVLVGGDFETVNGSARARFARLNLDGSLDGSFLNGLTGPNGRLRSLVATSHGKVLISGSFTAMNGQTRPGLAMLNDDGSLDSSFNISLVSSNNVGAFGLAIEPDGSLLVGIGSTTRTVNGLSRAGMFRIQAVSPTHHDYDGDGRSDLSVVRSTDNVWYLLQGTAGYTAQQFGEAGDRIAPADYDGDGKTDVAVFRPATGTWFVFMSQTQTFQQFGWGANGDLPVPTDRDNDGKADLVVFRPSNNTWYTRYANGTFATTEFGVAGDKPLVGDFDADGIGDIALFRPSNNNWYILKSSLGFFIQTWGEAGDIPVPADFDGDGATDQGVFRPSTGQWFLSRTTDGFGSQNWGQAGDIPVAADYDGDGKSDVAVFRPTNGTWYIVNSSTGQLIQQFGQPGDVPTQSAYLY